MNELQKRFEEFCYDRKQGFDLVTWDFFHAEINDMLDRLRLEKQEYEPDYPIPSTDTVEGYNSAVDDLNNKIERETK